MKLIAKKAGNGYVSSYTLNISLNDARKLGFVDNTGKSFDLEKIIDEKRKTITIALKKPDA